MRILVARTSIEQGEYLGHGVEAFSVVPSADPAFAPPQGVTPPVSFAWSALPDDYGALPSGDRRFIETAWAGLCQYGSSLLAQVLYLDAARSLTDAALFKPVRWVDLDFTRATDLTAVDDRVQASGAEVVYRNAADPAYIRFEAAGRMRFVAADIDGLSTTGAQEAALDLPANALGQGWVWFGMWGDTDGVLAAMHPDGRVALGVPAAVGFRWSLCAQAIDWTVGHTLKVAGAPLGQRVRVTLELDGEVISVETADRHIPRLKWSGILAPVADWATAGFFGRILAVDMVANGFSWTDTRIPAEVGACPTLRRNPASEDQITLDAFTLAGEGPARRIDLAYQGLHVYTWAPDLGLHADLLQQCFAPLVGVPAVTEGVSDTEESRNLLVGLLYGLTAGPTPHALSVALSAMAGAPLCLESGQVVSTVDPVGGPALVVQSFATGRRRVYRYAAHLTPRFNVGDLVEKLDVLTDGAEIEDWVSAKVGGSLRASDTWRDLEKFTQVYVRVPVLTPGTRADDPPRTFKDRARAYLAKALPLWMGAFRFLLELVGTLRERQLLSDHTRFELTYLVRDALTNGQDLRYNGGVHYDDGSLYDAHLDTVLVDRVAISLTNEGLSALSVTLLGDELVLASGDTANSEAV